LGPSGHPCGRERGITYANIDAGGNTDNDANINSDTESNPDGNINADCNTHGYSCSQTESDSSAASHTGASPVAAVFARSHSLGFAIINCDRTTITDNSRKWG
jgi:hypothetical protein